MDGLIVLIVLALIGLPLVLSIVALAVASGAKSEARQLRDHLRRLQAGEAPPRPVAGPAPGPATPRAAEPEPAPERKKAVEIFQAASPPPAPAEARAETATPPLPPVKPSDGLEVALGGKVASFIGIAALVLGVVFFVGYAIKENLIGPGMRVVLGLVFGGLLIALGYLAEIKGRGKLGILARVLTGGGTALLFFSVFAAHGFYGLISGAVALGGLAAVAAAALGLSVVYRSQTVAILGVLGAFITPLLIGGNFTTGLFPLVYIAAVNTVVMVLGVHRNWQSLYNIAYVFTVLYTFLWLNREVLHGEAGAAWITGLGFTILYFAQFIALGLVKLKGERGGLDQVIDMGRMLSSSLLLMGALYLVLDKMEFNDWIGASFLLAAAAHLALVRLAWRWLPRFKNDVLVLIAGALTFATLALPAQLDGVWVSLGWSIEGLLLAWLSARYRVTAFRLAGIFLGLLGLGKALVYDLRFSQDADLRLFLNPRFVVSLLSAGLLGAQAWICGRGREDETEQSGAFRVLEDIVLVIACVGVVLAVGFDGLEVLTERAPWAWMGSSVALALAGAFLVVFAASREDAAVLWGFGILLLVLLPVKILLLDVRGMGWAVYESDFPLFFNSIFVVGLILLAGVVLLGVRFGETEGAGISGLPAGPVLNIVSLVAGILLVTLEIYRAETAWKDSAVTLWWGGCALVLIFLGLRTGRRYLRYTALAVFGFTIFKVFLVDLSGLSGLIRVAAFMGVGLLLLVLSFTYQRLAPKLVAPAPDPQPEPQEQPGEDSA